MTPTVDKLLATRLQLKGKDPKLNTHAIFPADRHPPERSPVDETSVPLKKILKYYFRLKKINKKLRGG